MNTKKKYIIIFILGTLLSCHKEEIPFPNTSVSGNITSLCTGLPIEGASIELYRHNDPKILRRVLKKVKTDANGNYNLKFYGSKNEIYYVGYTTTNISGAYLEPAPWLTDIYRGDKIVKDVKVHQTSSLIINFKNVNYSDSIYVKATDHSLGNTNAVFERSSNDQFYGRYCQLTDCFPLMVYINWAVTKNHTTNYFSDSVLCTTGWNNSYLINY